MFSKFPSAKTTVILKHVYGWITHIYFFRPDKAIKNWKFVHCYLPHMDLCWQYPHIFLGYNTRNKKFLIPCFSHFLLFFSFTALFGWMSAFEKYKLPLLRLLKNNMHQTNIYFCDELLRAVYFQIKCELKQRNSKYKRVSQCMFLMDIAIL